jgi:glycosyltransferase involved in cell wall biosynthesis
LYHSSDFLLHTSLSEGHPIVAEEAMSCGLLVCGTAVGLLYDLPTCCISVPVTDHKALAEQVLLLIRDNQRMNTQKLAAHDWAKQHSMTWTVEKISELYSR